MKKNIGKAVVLTAGLAACSAAPEEEHGIPRFFFVERGVSKVLRSELDDTLERRAFKGDIGAFTSVLINLAQYRIAPMAEIHGAANDSEKPEVKALRKTIADEIERIQKRYGELTTYEQVRIRAGLDKKRHEWEGDKEANRGKLIALKEVESALKTDLPDKVRMR